MEYYSNIHLFLDRDKMGMEMTKLALQWSDKYRDQSQTYKQFKDLNEFLIKYEGPEIKQIQSRGLRLWILGVVESRLWCFSKNNLWTLFQYSTCLIK